MRRVLTGWRRKKRCSMRSWRMADRLSIVFPVSSTPPAGEKVGVGERVKEACFGCSLFAIVADCPRTDCSGYRLSRISYRAYYDVILLYTNVRRCIAQRRYSCSERPPCGPDLWTNKEYPPLACRQQLVRPAPRVARALATVFFFFFFAETIKQKVGRSASKLIQAGSRGMKYTASTTEGSFPYIDRALYYFFISEKIVFCGRFLCFFFLCVLWGVGR